MGDYGVMTKRTEQTLQYRRISMVFTRKLIGSSWKWSACGTGCKLCSELHNRTIHRSMMTRSTWKAMTPILRTPLAAAGFSAGVLSD